MQLGREPVKVPLAWQVMEEMFPMGWKPATQAGLKVYPTRTGALPQERTPACLGHEHLTPLLPLPLVAVTEAICHGQTGRQEGYRESKNDDEHSQFSWKMTVEAVQHDVYGGAAEAQGGTVPLSKPFAQNYVFILFFELT